MSDAERAVIEIGSLIIIVVAEIVVVMAAVIAWLRQEALLALTVFFFGAGIAYILARVVSMIVLLPIAMVVGAIDRRVHRRR